FRYRTKSQYRGWNHYVQLRWRKKAPHHHRRRRLYWQQFHTSCASRDWRRSVPRRRLRDHEDSSPRCPGIGKGSSGKQGGLGKEAQKNKPWVTLPRPVIYLAPTADDFRAWKHSRQNT